MSFVGDCSDAALLEDVLSSLHDALRHNSPTHAPLVACLRSQGGERLFMSLLQREQQSLRLLGLQLLTAFVGPAPQPSPLTEGKSPAQYHAQTYMKCKMSLLHGLNLP